MIGIVKRVKRVPQVDKDLVLRLVLVGVSQGIHLAFIKEEAVWLSTVLYAMLAISAVQLVAHWLKTYCVVVRCEDGMIRRFNLHTRAFEKGQRVQIGYNANTGYTLSPM